MTVSTTIRERRTACDGATVAFPTGFQLIQPGDLVVRLVDDATRIATVLTEGVHYTLTGDLRAGLSTVTTLGAYPAGKTLWRRRETARVQLADYVPNDGFPAELHEGQLDRLTMVDQELAGALDDLAARAVLVPDGEAGLVVPPAAARPGRVLGFGADPNVLLALLPGGADGALRTDLAASMGASLVGFLQSGTGAVARSQQAKSREVLSAADFGVAATAAASVNVAALRAALAELAARGGGELLIGAGVFNLDSATLGLAGLSLTQGVRVRGSGRRSTQLVVTGTTACNVFAGLNASDIGVSDLRITGNSVSTGEGEGEAIRVLLRPDAVASVENITIDNVRLDNFKAPWWIVIENQAGGTAGAALTATPSPYTMDNIRISRIRALFNNGNSINPASVQTHAHVVKILGYSGIVQDVEITDFMADCGFGKGGISVFHHVAGVRIVKPLIRNAGTNPAGASDDAAAYAIELYDGYLFSSGIVVDHPRIENPRSCGIYVAGCTDVTIINPKVFGQTDTQGGTLPKGAIVLNTSKRVTIVGGDLSDNYVALAIAGPTETGNGQMGHEISGTRMRNNSRGIEITYSMIIAICYGVKISAVDIRSTVFGLRVQSTATNRIDDVTVSASYISGGIYGIDFYAGADHAGDLYRVTGSTVNAETGVALRAVNQTGRLILDDVEASVSAAGATVVQANGCTKLKLREVTATGNGGNGYGFNLTGSAGALWGLTAPGCTYVNAGGLGNAAPTHAGPRGQAVQNLAPTAGGVDHWRAVDGAGTWKAVALAA